MRHLVIILTAAGILCSVSVGWAGPNPGLENQIESLKNRIAELESRQSDQSYRDRNAELIREMVKEMSSRPYAMSQTTGVTAGYDKRFFIKSSDDQFKLEFDTRIQFRHTYASADGHNNVLNREGLSLAKWEDLGLDPDDFSSADSSASAFEAERARLYLSGHVLKDIKYQIVLSMGDDDSAAANNVRLYTYYLSYSVMPEMGIKVGRYKGAFGKQENTSSGRQQFVDRSLANEVFNISRTTGVEAFGEVPAGEAKAYYRLGIYNSFHGDSTTPFADNDNAPAFAARITLPLMGATPVDFKNESDLMKHQNPVSQIGASFAYSNSRDEGHFAGGEDDNYEVLVPGGDGKTNIVEALGEVTMFGVDYSFKHLGFSLNIEAFCQTADLDSPISYEHDFGTARDAAGVDGSSINNYGFIVQAGTFVDPDHTVEFVGRLSGVAVDSSNDSYEYAVGWNWYPSGSQDLKVSLDASYIDDLPIVSSAANYDGVQNNSLLLIRTQVQFQF